MAHSFSLMLLAATSVLLAVAIPTAHREVHALDAVRNEECTGLVKTAKEGCIGCDAKDFRKEIEEVFKKHCDEALGDHFFCVLCEECIAKAPADVLDSLHQMDDAAICGKILSMPLREEAIAPDGNDVPDMPDSYVKEKTDGAFESCAHVAAQGLCHTNVAKAACATSCKSTIVSEAKVSAQKVCG